MSPATEMAAPPAPGASEIAYRPFDQTPADLAHIVRLVETELSEPYTVYTYRYFLHQWPSLAFLAFPAGEPSSPAVGIVVCKLESHRGKTMRGYLAMLSVDPAWRQRGIAKHLLRLAIDQMRAQGADEVVLETEADNDKSLGLYERMGFWREKRLWRFYLNGKDAFRLILPLRTPPPPLPPPAPLAPAPLPLSAEDDFGSAPFLSADSFAPATTDGSSERTIELSAGMAALVDRVREEADVDDDDDDDEDPRLPSHRLAQAGGVISDDDDDENEDEEGDIEIENLPPPLPSPTKPGRSETPLSADPANGLEPLEVSDEEGGSATAGVRRPHTGDEEDDEEAEEEGLTFDGGGRAGEGDGRLAASLTGVRI